jgi:hypothetical protein
MQSIGLWQRDMRICFAKNVVGFSSTSFQIPNKKTNKSDTVYEVDILLSRSNKALDV